MAEKTDLSTDGGNAVLGLSALFYLFVQHHHHVALPLREQLGLLLMPAGLLCLSVHLHRPARTSFWLAFAGLAVAAVCLWSYPDSTPLNLFCLFMVWLMLLAEDTPVRRFFLSLRRT